MKTAALLHLVSVLTYITIGTASPAQARTDWLNQSAPHWLDQTVYRPNCLSADCACDCRSHHVCLPSCVRW